jgi:ElaB/YqjD/DUF883 family membrane-anchored ribosome-binding protein
MDQEQGTAREGVTGRDVEEIREDIEQTREELGDTVEAVAEKADVKGQAKAKFSDLKGQASAKTREYTEKAKGAAPESTSAGADRARRFAQENPVPLAIGGAFVVGFLLGKRRSR